MKSMRSMFLIRAVFLLVMVAFITAGHGFLSGDRTEQPVLARVEVGGMLDDLHLPVYAHLQGAAGSDYALVIAPQSQLEREGVPYRILDKNAIGADYFILNLFAPDKQARMAQLRNVLLNDGEQVIIRSTFPQVEKLAESGFDVHWLGRSPMIVKAPRQQTDASIMAITYDAAVDQMINQVNQTTLETYTGNLSGENPVNIGGSGYTITSRHTDSGTPIDKATQYVYEFMQGHGLTTSYHNWTASIYSGRNVIGEIPGTTQADEIVLITAHLDCMPSGSIAPGADDNASGSVGVMLCAEVLKQHTYKRTVRFVFFTGEEQGILGANEYSDMIYLNGDNVVAVYNMDMISYDGTGGPDLRLHTRTTASPGYPGDLAIANTFIDVVNTYSLSGVLNPIIDADGITQSDHSAFWNNGYSAILGIEEHDADMTPYYHTTSDTVSTLNWTYFTNFARASVGTAAHLALVDDGTLIPDFTGTPTSGGYPLTVDFTDLSIGATSWSWDFGDTGTSTERHPTYTYTSIGVYTVTLTVSNASGSDFITKTDYITVTAPQLPAADFSASATSIYVGDSVTFTDLSTENPTSWDWTFAGGTPASSTEQNPTITYNTAGTYTVALTVTNVVGSDTETKVDYITVAEKPYCTSQGNTQADEYIGRVQIADLDNSSGPSPYSDFTSMTANMTADTTVNVTLTPTYTGTTYTEYWKIWIDYNNDHDFEDPGEEVFSGSGTTPISGSFTVASGIDVTTRMRVTMKYGSYATPCETFTYGEVEDYTANISDGGCSAPAADFSVSATTITEGDSVTFTDLSTNNPDTWAWTFAGGTPGTDNSQNPTITYNTAGTYAVTLIAGNTCGSDTETKVDYITVNPACQPPAADFSVSATTITAGDSVTFTDLSTNNPDTWAWTFAGGTPGTGSSQNPTITYNTAGTYAVTLIAGNTCGSDTETKVDYITVNPAQTAEIYVYDITQNIIKAGSKYKSNATVTIWDTNSVPVADATVTITWSGSVSGSASGTTAADGTVTFTSDKVKSTGPFIITIDNVSHATRTYNPALNNETSDSASF